MMRLAEANIEAFLAYFNEPEDYLNLATDTTVTFEQVVEFMKRLKDVRELDTYERVTFVPRQTPHHPFRR